MNGSRTRPHAICERCGKILTGRPYWVRLNHERGGTPVPMSAPEDHASSLFLVGASCAATFPKDCVERAGPDWLRDQEAR